MFDNEYLTRKNNALIAALWYEKNNECYYGYYYNCSWKIIGLARICSFFFIIIFNSLPFNFHLCEQKGSSRFNFFWSVVKCIKRGNNYDVRLQTERWISVLFLHHISTCIHALMNFDDKSYFKAKGIKVYLSENRCAINSTAGLPLSLSLSVVLTWSKILFQCQRTLFSLSLPSNNITLYNIYLHGRCILGW